MKKFTSKVSKPIVIPFKGGLVAIGGDVVRKANFPKTPKRVIKEATQEQYAELYENGLSALIKVEEIAEPQEKEEVVKDAPKKRKSKVTKED